MECHKLAAHHKPLHRPPRKLTQCATAPGLTPGICCQVPAKPRPKSWKITRIRGKIATAWPRNVSPLVTRHRSPWTECKKHTGCKSVRVTLNRDREREREQVQLERERERENRTRERQRVNRSS